MNADAVTATEREWLDTRRYLREHRSNLDHAATTTYPGARTVAGTPLLTRPEWIPRKPLPLEAITLEFDLAARAPASPRLGWLPTRADGHQYSSYAEAIATLAAPTVFEDRPTYRLLDADLTGDRPRLWFGLGSYFDSINTGEAAAHEAAQAHRGRPTTGGLREMISDPCDPAQRPVNLAISTLTLRREPETGAMSFLLHWRDPHKVGHAGGLYQVVPVGIFQPSGYATWNVDNDFSLWRNTIRELAEELRDEDEDYDSDNAPIDYHHWPFAARLDQARRDGQVAGYCLGLGVDPTSFATDLLSVLVIDAPVFDELFGCTTGTNAEGRVLAAEPFTAATVDHILDRHPMQAAGAALLRLAIAAPLS